MATQSEDVKAQPAILPEARALTALSASRLLVMGGITLIIVGMLFGDIFAVFVLHQNAGRVREQMLAATRAVESRDAQGVLADFTTVGGLLENRGTKVDTHVHLTDFGYLALLLALLQPYVALSEECKRRMATLFLTGATLLPVSVFLIHYLGLTYSPWPAFGWASILADFGGLLAIIACATELNGLWRYVRGRHETSGRIDPNDLLKDYSWASRALLAGGTLLVLAGFIHGAYFAAVHLYQLEQKEVVILQAIVHQAADNNLPAAAQAVDDDAALQGEAAVHIAAHAHVIKFGLLAYLLAFIQPFVFLTERWKRRWVKIMLLGSALLPVAVLLELRLGLVPGGIADIAGLLVIIALIGMLVGAVRYTGRLDARTL